MIGFKQRFWLHRNLRTRARWTVLPALCLAVFLPTANAQNAARYEYDTAGNRVRAANQARIADEAALFFHPARGLPGDRVNVYGRNFAPGGNYTVAINGLPAEILSVAPTVITLLVPQGAESGDLVITLSGGGTVNLSFFEVAGVQDSDGDRLPDFLEPLIRLHPNNPDSDGDGVFDGDEDYDNDNLSNYGELVVQSFITDPDTDRDGILDGDEDSDIDDVTDGDEIRLGTDPFNPDSDFDTWPDGVEVLVPGDPLDENVMPRLAVRGAPRATLLVTGVGDPGRFRPNTVRSNPAVDVLRPGVGEAGARQNVTRANPPVNLLLPGVGDAGSRQNVTRSNPPVNLLLPGAGGAENLAANATRSNPPVNLLLPGVGASNALSANTTRAHPPVNIILPGAGGGGGAKANTTRADPPVTVQIVEQ